MVLGKPKSARAPWNPPIPRTLEQQPIRADADASIHARTHASPGRCTYADMLSMFMVSLLRHSWVTFRHPKFRKQDYDYNRVATVIQQPYAIRFIPFIYS